MTVPPGVTGDPKSQLRVYLALQDQKAAPIQDTPLAAVSRNIIPVTLTKGINDFTVTIVGPGGESEPSAVVRYILDQTVPSLKVTSPASGSVVNARAVKIVGKTQGRSTVNARNTTTGDSIVGTADADGIFRLSLPLATGGNSIQLTSTDPAGNEKTVKLTDRRGSGKLTVSLGSSTYRIKRGSLPRDLRLTATVNDPDGQPLKGAAVTFTLSIPGIPSVTQDGHTDANGRAVWQTIVPAGATLGQGSAAVLVTADGLGTTSDQTVITVTK